MKKLLLASVFGPYGVDDHYGRKESVMEAMHNQITREQGVFSVRFAQETYAFHLLAENLEIPTAVLDFPTQRRFIREIKKGYDYVGLSFVAPNFMKTKRMAQLVRKHSPNSKIILGGHGTAIKDVDRQIPSDYVCRGDGVRFMRELFNLDTSQPIKAPLRDFCVNRYILGVPINNKILAHGVILPGVGCVNACRFCSTTHFFQRKYVAFLETGQDVFNVCRQYEDQKGITDFWVQDENFFKQEKRARELLALMEKHKKAYTFNTFSSADTLVKMGTDFLQRIGVEFLWIGAESKHELYYKNKGIDLKQLIKDLRERGINILASGILFIEKHTKENIQEDIDYLLNMQSDFLQFMEFGPIPGTALFKDYQNKGKLLPGVPYEEWHGQGSIWYEHPHFTPDESYAIIKDAFKQSFDKNGPGLLRVAETALMGTIRAEKLMANDEFMKLRYQTRRKRALDYYPALDALVAHAHNPHVKAYAKEIKQRYKNYFKSRSLKTILYSTAMQTMIIKEKIRSKFVENNIRQPPILYTKYRF